MTETASETPRRDRDHETARPRPETLVSVSTVPVSRITETRETRDRDRDRAAETETRETETRETETARLARRDRDRDRDSGLAGTETARPSLGSRLRARVSARTETARRDRDRRPARPPVETETARRVSGDWSSGLGSRSRRDRLAQTAAHAAQLAAEYQPTPAAETDPVQPATTPAKGDRLRLVPPIAALGTAFVLQVIAVTDTVGGALVAALQQSPVRQLAAHAFAGYLVAAMLGVAVACCAEGGAAYLMDLYDKHLLARDSVWVLRLAMMAYVGGSGAAIHWWTTHRHLPEVTSWLLAGMSASALFLWSRGSRWRNRVEMRSVGQLDPALPKLPMAAKLMHPGRWLVTLWLVSWEPVGTTDEARARYREWHTNRAASREAKAAQRAAARPAPPAAPVKAIAEVVPQRPTPPPVAVAAPAKPAALPAAPTRTAVPAAQQAPRRRTVQPIRAAAPATGLPVQINDPDLAAAAARDAAHVRAVMAHHTDWARRVKRIGKDDVTAATGVTGSSTTNRVAQLFDRLRAAHTAGTLTVKEGNAAQ